MKLKPYRRAYLTQQRTLHWKNIVAKNNGEFGVDIIWECEREDEINIKEIEFIALYGRQDLNNGSLINLTDGGEGVVGVIQRPESIALRSGKNHYNYKGGLMLDYQKDKERRAELKKVIDVSSGVVYKNSDTAAKALGIQLKNLSRYLNGIRPNKTSLCYLKDYKEGIVNVNIKKEHIGSSKKVIDIASGKRFLNAREAARHIGCAEVTMYKKLQGRLPNNTNLRYA